MGGKQKEEMVSNLPKKVCGFVSVLHYSWCVCVCLLKKGGLRISRTCVAHGGVQNAERGAVLLPGGRSGGARPHVRLGRQQRSDRCPIRLLVAGGSNPWEGDFDLWTDINRLIGFMDNENMEQLLCDFRTLTLSTIGLEKCH